ncbi:hypothetical protein ABZ749_09840, partial [Micromonospora sp. NPDC047753]
YTACAALGDPRVRSLFVVEAIEDVIDWHQRAGPALTRLTAPPVSCRRGRESPDRPGPVSGEVRAAAGVR